MAACTMTYPKYVELAATVLLLFVRRVCLLSVSLRTCSSQVVQAL